MPPVPPHLHAVGLCSSRDSTCNSCLILPPQDSPNVMHSSLSGSRDTLAKNHCSNESWLQTFVPPSHPALLCPRVGSGELFHSICR